MMRIRNNYVTLFECPGSVYPPKFCCGPDPTSCWSNNSSFIISLGTIILREFQLSDHATILSMGGSSAAISTTSTTPISITAFHTAGSTATPSPQPLDDPSPKSLGIGLGIGLLLGLALLVLLFLHYRELRKHNRQGEGGNDPAKMELPAPAISYELPERLRWGLLGDFVIVIFIFIFPYIYLIYGIGGFYGYSPRFLQ